jgi:RimJ/RimL family protein N-acetyltransferase
VRVELEPWPDDGLPLLQAANAPAMTEHLGGPETDDEVEARHRKYLRFRGTGEAVMSAIVADGERCGGIGWWHTEWDGDPVLETGWFVLPAAQGHGLAARALALVVDDAREHADRDRLLAFPSVANEPSNRVCARSGFRRTGERTLPFRGVELHVAVWELALR